MTPKTQDGNKALAALLRAARRMTGETQTEFATRIGVTQPTVSRWEETGPVGSLSRAYVEKIIADIDRVHPINRK